MAQQVELACLAADRGLFDTAGELASSVGPDRVEFAACQSLIASIYRQLERHDLAEPHDRAGRCSQVPDELGRALCGLGLVADGIGSAGADLDQRMRDAEALLAQVAPDHWAVRWFDPWLTHAWVRAEMCLVADDPRAAIRVLEPFALVRPRGVPNTRWPHERAKTWLFLGVAQRCAGQLDPARRSLERAAAIAARSSLRPLLLPAVAQLAEFAPETARQWQPQVAAARRVLLRHAPAGLAIRRDSESGNGDP